MFDPSNRITISGDAAEEAKALAKEYQHRNPGDAQRSDEGSTPGGFRPSVNDYGQARSVVMGHGQLTTPGYSRVTSSEIAPRDEAAGVLSTARSSGGRPVSGPEVTRDTRVLVHGIETTAAAAAAMGLLRINPATGYYEDAYQAGVGQHQAEQSRGTDRYANSAPATPPNSQGGDGDGDDLPQSDQQNDQDQAEGDDQHSDQIPPFNDELESHIRDFYPEKIGNLAFEAGLSELIATGELSETVATTIATTMGIAPEEVRSRATGLRDAFETQAMEMTGLGDGLREVLQTMQRIDPALVQRAVRDHVELGKASAYDKLIDEWLYRLPELRPDIILGSDQAKELGIRQEKDGSITVAVPGAGRTTWQAAIRAGLINPGYTKPTKLTR